MKRLIRSSTGKFPRALTGIVALLLIVALVPTVTSAGAAVWTDKADYPPGDTVVISGSGLPSKTKLVVQIFRPHGTDLLSTKTDSQGSFTLDYELTPDRAMLGTYTIIVINPANGQILATTTFTDGPVKYTVAFHSTGLPSGTTWSVSFGGDPKSNAAADKAFNNIDPGTYSWSIPTASGGTGIQYVPSPASGSVTVSGADIDVYITFTTQYQVNFAVSPAGSGTTSPSGTAWYDSGAQAISATANSGFAFSSWSSSTSSIVVTSTSSASTSSTISGTGTLTANFVPTASTYDVTFTESGLPDSTSWSVTFNSVTQSSTTSTITFSGVSAGSHSWTVLTPISGASGVRYIASTSSGTMSVPSTVSQIIPYTTQYELTMVANFGTTSPSLGGSNWYTAGSTATISATAPSVSPGEQYVWNGWAGSGTISYTGTDNPATSAVTMNSPVTETASWTHQFRLSMATNFGSTSPVVGDVWYNAGSVVTISATSPAVVAGEQYVWNGWAGSGTISYTGTDNPATSAVTMNSPVTETASWTHQYLVHYEANVPVTVPADEWVESGQPATGEFLTPQYNIAGDIKYVFVSDDRPGTITGPTTITGIYDTELTSDLKVMPVSINTDSKGQWVMAKINFPSGSVQSCTYNSGLGRVTIRISDTDYEFNLDAFVLTLTYGIAERSVSPDPTGPVSCDTISGQLTIKYKRTDYTNVLSNNLNVPPGEYYNVSLDATSTPTLIGSELELVGDCTNRRSNNGI